MAIILKANKVNLYLLAPAGQIRGVRWADFFLFPRLKSVMKGERLADVAAIQERVTAVLRSILKEVFADSF
jgi:hypothetical protein